MCHNRLQIEESSKPARLSQQLQSPVTNYKPVANHSYNVRNLQNYKSYSVNSSRVTDGHSKLMHQFCATWCLTSWLLVFLLQLEYEKKKKEEGKRARADKQQVLDMLFSAFEKHQYYNIKDLVDITKQPVVRLWGTISPNLKKTRLSILLSFFLCFPPPFPDLLEGNSAGYWNLQCQRNS